MPLPSSRKAGLRAGRQMQVAVCEIPLAGDPEILRRERFETVPYRRRPQRLALLDNTLLDLRIYQAV
ncbi:MAG: hypothetical protein H6Q41_2110 [Deltaproteobacteria bacterium]|jgi:hypothetical protein|nr:hypothetical protein [Deltaproteobacteria bacterium]